MGKTLETMNFTKSIGGPPQKGLNMNAPPTYRQTEHEVMGDTIATMNLNTQTNINTMKTDFVYTNNQNQTKFEDVYDDYYPDDFEEIDVYNSDEEEGNPVQYRLTKAATKEDLDQTLNIVKDYVDGNKNKLVGQEQFLSAITEQPIEQSGGTMLGNSTERKLKRVEDQKESLKNTCINELGKQVFEEIYQYLSIHRAKGTDDSKVYSIWV